MQQRVKGVISAKMVKIIKFLFFAQKVSSGMGELITSQIFFPFSFSTDLRF